MLRYIYFCTKKPTISTIYKISSMQAVAKSLQARASEHLFNFCEQIEQRPDFVSGTIKLQSAARVL